MDFFSLPILSFSSSSSFCLRYHNRPCLLNLPRHVFLPLSMNIGLSNPNPKMFNKCEHDLIGEFLTSLSMLSEQVSG